MIITTATVMIVIYHYKFKAIVELTKSNGNYKF